MADTTRYTKTEMGAAEIGKRRKNLRGRMRTMLILIDPSRTADELRAQAAQLGVPDDFLETLVREGYLAPVAGAEGTPADAATQAVSDRELARFRRAQAFMQETIVDAMGVRALLFTLKLERCVTRAELAALLPDYEKGLAKFRDEAQTRLLVQRAKDFLA
ncbi:MAG TPA: hypothetical protein VMU96_11945 [Casimicrobiaceae bacterium]|nr:hypothetical protein [Casimicrobiaceae bacterium]